VPTLAEMRLLAQQRADLVGSDFVTDAEWRSYLNGSIAELYDLLLTKFGNDYYVAEPYEFTTTTAERYALPADFYKLLAVDLEQSGAPSGYVTLRPFNFAERNRYTMPPAGKTIVVHYAPRIEALVSDDDEIDGISGWEELVVVDAARKALLKEESDTTAIEREKAGLIARIEIAAENRDAGSPSIVVDTSGEEWGEAEGGLSRGAGFLGFGSEMRYRLNGSDLWLRGGAGWP
jgi:hypothetical protein